jgi:hypothetical protein
MNEKETLKREIEDLEKNLGAYLKLFPILEVSKSEKERVVNQFLDDILIRKEKLKKLE